MLDTLKLYLKGTKIQFRDTTLTRRSILYKIGFFVVLGVGSYIWYLLQASSNHGLELLKDIVRILPIYVTVLWSVVIPVVLGLTAQALFEHFFREKYKQLQHRERLAKAIVDNGLYTMKRVEKQGGYSEMFGKIGKEELAFFPKMFYRMKDGVIYVTVETVTGKMQKPLSNLESELELGLFCELIDKESKEFYMEYTFLYDMIRKRISIDEVVVENGAITLMQGITWNFAELPHALIVGGTGGGKTYFILTLIYALLKSGAVLSVLDPKRADLSDLADIMPNVYCLVDDMIEELKHFYEEMMERVTIIKQMPNYKTGVNYAYVGLEPHFLIFDEYVAFMEMVGRRREEVLTYMKQIVMLGRQVGYFLILACQRPDTKYFADGMRDQFGLRVALGKNSEIGYGMVFGSECKKLFFYKKIKGRGYIDIGGSVNTEFYSPLVPQGYNFLENIRLLCLGATQPHQKEEQVESDCEDDF